MKIEDLQEYFKKAKSNKIGFSGKCHDCREQVIVNVDLDETGELTVSGGAVYNSKIDEDLLFLKCDQCFERDKVLRNFQPCEVYSRIVGYLRPVNQWNPGKKAEFNNRLNYRLI